MAQIIHMPLWEKYSVAHHQGKKDVDILATVTLNRGNGTGRPITSFNQRLSTSAWSAVQDPLWYCVCTINS